MAAAENAVAKLDMERENMPGLRPGLPRLIPKTATFKKLETKLLAIGGSKVLSVWDPHLDQTLEFGRIFDTKRRKRLYGPLQECHCSSAIEYLSSHIDRGKPTCKIATGWALYSDGRWVSHSWVWDGKRILETTVEFDVYFGIALSPSQARSFVLWTFLSRMPGFSAARSRLLMASDGSLGKYRKLLLGPF